MAYAVKQYVDVVQLKADLSYSLANLSDAMVTQASLFTHYGVIAAQASRQVDEVKMLLEVAEARVYRLLRDQFAKDGEKISEARLEQSVAIDKRIITFKRALNEAKQIESAAKTAVEAFRHRRDMLVQQGLISREELKGELSIARRQVVEDTQESQRQRVLEGLKSRQQTNGAQE